jgi:hypothetical protein
MSRPWQRQKRVLSTIASHTLDKAWDAAIAQKGNELQLLHED